MRGRNKAAAGGEPQRGGVETVAEEELAQRKAGIDGRKLPAVGNTLDGYPAFYSI
ncbi:TPA: hypothetical protein ACYUXQ_005021 [Escherichia coli]